MDEWMSHLYSAFLCTTVHPKHFTVISGVSPQPPQVGSIHLDESQNLGLMSHLKDDTGSFNIHIKHINIMIIMILKHV